MRLYNNQDGASSGSGTGKRNSIERELNGGESSPGISVRTNEIHQLDRLLCTSSVTMRPPAISTDKFEVMQQSIVSSDDVTVPGKQ